MPVAAEGFVIDCDLLQRRLDRLLLDIHHLRVNKLTTFWRAQLKRTTHTHTRLLIDAVAP